jgi:HEAT repeat protein
MLRTYALELKDAFFPHVADVARVLVPLIGFQYMDEVRVNACHAMPDLLDSAILALQKGAPSATPDVVHQLKGYLYKAVIDQLHKEPDTETLAELLTAWCEIIKHGEECDAAKLTPEELQQSFEVVKELVVEVIERRDERSKAAGDEEGDDEEEDAREADAINDENLISTLVECLGTLFKVYGSPLLPLFQAQLQPIVQAMLQPTAAEPDRVAALCVFDDIIEHCSADGGATEYARTLLPAYLQYARDPKPEVRQAAVYGLGVLAACDNGAAFGAAQQQQAAQVLIEVFEAEQAFDEDNASASDNAVSALGKLCARTPEIGAVGWPRWLNVLPIRADKEEAWKVHQQLVQLVEASNTAVMGASMERLPDIICIFGEILGTDLIEPGLELRITHLLKQVRDGLPQVLSALPSHPRFARLKPNQRTQLERALSS